MQISNCMRQVCLECGLNPRAVNYHRNGKIYYRKLCDSCDRKKTKKNLHEKSRWQLAGYRQKSTCEKCGFVPAIPNQLVVFSIDRNQQSIAIRNLKTVCLNCNYELSITGWTQGDLEEDL
jgi:hypothetical protein